MGQQYNVAAAADVEDGRRGRTTTRGVFVRTTGRALTLALACALLLSGCVSQGLAFRIDDRLTITAPESRAEVGLPLTVRWEVERFRVAAQGSEPPSSNAGYFAVFVDATPQPPGKGLAWLSRKDRSCRPADGCPDAEYLAAKYIFTTTDTHITFEQLPRPAKEKGKERHTVTIVLLDTAEKRIGESAFYVDFSVNRKGAS